jgi:hypothetical protein
MSKPAAVGTRLIDQRAVLSARGTVQLGRDLNFATLNLDNANIHKSGSSEEN